MPLYEVECGACGARDTVFRSVAERDRELPAHCERPMQRVILPAMVRGEIPAFQSPIDGRPINSRKQWKEDLKRNGCRPWEGLTAERQHAASIQASHEAQFERKMQDGAADVLNNMSRDKQDALKRVRV